MSSNTPTQEELNKKAANDKKLAEKNAADKAALNQASANAAAKQGAPAQGKETDKAASKEQPEEAAKPQRRAGSPVEDQMRDGHEYNVYYSNNLVKILAWFVQEGDRVAEMLNEELWNARGTKDVKKNLEKRVNYVVSKFLCPFKLIDNVLEPLLGIGIISGVNKLINRILDFVFDPMCDVVDFYIIDQITRGRTPEAIQQELDALAQQNLTQDEVNDTLKKELSGPFAKLEDAQRKLREYQSKPEDEKTPGKEAELKQNVTKAKIDVTTSLSGKGIPVEDEKLAQEAFDKHSDEIQAQHDNTAQSTSGFNPTPSPFNSSSL